MNILVSGSLAYDKIMEYSGRFGDHLVPDKAHALSISFVTEKFREHFGGTAGNIAYGLALLGERPSILSSAGHDFEAYRNWLMSVGSLSGQVNPLGSVPGAQPETGVDIQFVRIIADKATTLSNIMTDRADNQIAALYLGAMADSCEIKEEDIPTDAIAIVAPGNIKDMRRLPELYRKKHVPYMYDPAQQIPALDAEDLKNGITGSKIFISNDYELAMVLKKIGWTEEDVLAKTEILVTTLGEKGSRIRVGANTFDIPPVVPKGVLDPTGAGDAYRAGFIKGLILGWPLEATGKFAAVMAACAIEVYGSQGYRISFAEAKMRYKENFGTDVPA
jgi:adenosine kinase